MNNLINHVLHWQVYDKSIIIDDNYINVFKISVDIYQTIKDSCKLILTSDELNKANRFAQEDDKKRYIVGKFYSKMLLAKMMDKKPTDIHFEFNKYKKPYINNIHFNISHSGDYVVIGLSTNAIGVDIEYINTNLDYQNLIYQCFNGKEIKMITDLYSFYLFWTRKEALLKATGEGLTDNLPAIDCTVKNAERFGVFYELKSFKLNDGYFLSIASSKHQSMYKYWHLT
ncbi:4'-phosphopantetheinyl transferase family protein [Pedobacter lithocola]|uniref:4'-phosphopantetheinyl transferase family protein n=1 Tax=Pedobacter lithocola TaxID=1908239 RepID=A0ABV8P753_9SPHI